MVRQVKLGDFAVDVVLKNIKNIHLSVHPPTGRVRIAAPSRMSLDTIRVFAVTKLGWIKQQQTKLQVQERETKREYLDRESHYVWGKRYLLTVCESSEPPSVEMKHSRILLQMRPGTDREKRRDIMEEWYREQIKKAVPPLLTKWEPRLCVKVERCFVRRMKTKWGSCYHAARHIRLNTELAKKPHECLEYILVHEIAHLREHTHNDHFIALMDQHMPQWRLLRQKLNAAPLSHETWSY